MKEQEEERDGLWAKVGAVTWGMLIGLVVYMMVIVLGAIYLESIHE